MLLLTLPSTFLRLEVFYACEETTTAGGGNVVPVFVHLKMECLFSFLDPASKTLGSENLERSLEKKCFSIAIIFRQ